MQTETEEPIIILARHEYSSLLVRVAWCGYGREWDSWIAVASLHPRGGVCVRRSDRARVIAAIRVSKGYDEGGEIGTCTEREPSLTISVSRLAVSIGEQGAVGSPAAAAGSQSEDAAAASESIGAECA